MSKNVCNSVSIAERCIAFVFCDRLLTGHFIVDEKSGFIQSEKGQELVGVVVAHAWPECRFLMKCVCLC